jgi:MscS family membrane protein
VIQKLLGLLFACLMALAPATGTAQSAGDLARNPLSPPDLSSPQATLNTFLTEATAAVDAYYAGDPQLMRARADRGFQTFDAEFPENETGFLQAIESSLYLLEILIRIDLPPASKIPGAATPAEEMPPYWTIPQTEIRLVRIESKVDARGGYRFSAETIARLPDFYRRVRQLPVKAGYAKYDGVVERFRLRPGFAAPGFFVSYIQSLPAAWFHTFGGEPWWKWTTLAITVLAALVLFALAYRFTAALEGGTRSTAGATALVRPLLAVIAFVLIVFVRYVAVDVIRLTGTQREVAVAALVLLTHLAVIWMIFLIAVRVANFVIRMREMGVYNLDTQLVRLVSKLVAVLLAFYVLIDLAEALGVPVAPVLAGLGVGGLAVALAVRPTLENIVAGFVLFADAPVRVGEFCRFGDKMGTVEAIGLRSVRVRGIDRTVITVPNAEFCQLQLVNFTRRDAILLHAKLQLRYETTPDQLRFVLARLRELLIKHPKVSPDPARVRFVEYGASSLDLEIFAFVETRDFSEFLAVQEDLNLRIKDIVEASGTAFAFPSQTLYVERSHGLDAALTRASETEVERWRSEDRLPFPDHDERARHELSNTLDYPPQGSPGHR